MEEVKRGDWIQVLRGVGARPAWEGRKGFVQQTLTRDGLPIIFAYLWGEGTALLSKDQVQIIKEPKIIGGEGK